MTNIQEFAAACLLAINSISDLRKREILLVPTFCFFSGGVLTALIRDLLRNEIPFVSRCLALIPGILILMLTWMTRGQVGAGDGIVFLALGAWLSGREIVLIFLMTAFLAGGEAAVLFLRRHSPKETFPMIPCVFAAWVIVELLLWRQVI